MRQHPFASRLRYMDAASVDDSVVEIHDLDVLGPDAEKIGTVDGFIVDTQASRVLYVVVDAGGWFTSDRFLLPVGDTQLAADGRALQASVTKASLEGYPEFDETGFSELSDEDLRAYETRLASVHAPGDVLGLNSEWPEAFHEHPLYRQPSWWMGRRLDDGRETATGNGDRAPRGESPHSGGRAQPGDVLGIETAGERTELGDTAEDEDERRREAIEAAPGREKG